MIFQPWCLTGHQSATFDLCWIRYNNHKGESGRLVPRYSLGVGWGWWCVCLSWSWLFRCSCLSNNVGWGTMQGHRTGTPPSFYSSWFGLPQHSLPPSVLHPRWLHVKRVWFSPWRQRGTRLANRYSLASLMMMWCSSWDFTNAPSPRFTLENKITHRHNKILTASKLANLFDHGKEGEV
jgi:hypothetical protein